MLCFAIIGGYVAIFSPTGSISGGIPFISKATNDQLGRIVFGLGSLISFWLFTIAIRDAFSGKKK